MMGGPVLTQFRRWFASNETYMRAYPEPQRGMRLEHDLFDGVVEK